MPRRPTKSPPVQFRIPIELWDTLANRAANANKSVNDFVRDAIIRSLEPR